MGDRGGDSGERRHPCVKIKTTVQRWRVLLPTLAAQIRRVEGGAPGEVPVANGAVYSATKAAVDAITQSLAQDLGAQGIRVNSLQPGVTVTEGFRAMGESSKEFEKVALSRTPLGRIGEASDIAGAALFLATDDSGWVTGAEIPVSGGIRT